MKVLIIDNGLYVSLAQVLGESGLFDHVGYYADWKAAFPSGRDSAVGAGFDEFEREYELMPALDKYDAFVFPDLYHADLQQWLRGQDVPVWGAGDDEILEIDRQRLVVELPEIVPAAVIWPGLDAARNVAKVGDFIKVAGYYRGDTETIKVDADDRWYHELKLRLGPLADRVEFIVQPPIEGDHVEIGFDALVAHGKILSPMLLGIEIKDKAYLGKVVGRDYDDALRKNIATIEKVLSSDYSCFLSTEFIDNKLIDLTTRMPQPPGDAELRLFNIAHIIGQTLHNDSAQSVSPHAETVWCAQLILRASDAKSFLSFDVPKEFAPNVFIHRAFKLDGKLWAAPTRDESLPEIGSIVAVGDDAAEAIDFCKAVADELKLPNGVEVDERSLDEAQEKFEKYEKEA